MDTWYYIVFNYIVYTYYILVDQPLGHTDNLAVGISRFYIKTYTIIASA